VVREAQTILAGVDWQSSAGQQLLEQLSTRDSWPLKFLGDAGRDVLLRMVRRHEANYVLSVLVRDAATRSQALEIVESRPEAEQLEILGGLDLENPWFHADLSREPRAKALLLAQAVSLSLAARWRSCTLADLEALAREELRRAPLAESWLAPIVVQLGTRAVAARCPGSRLGDDLLEFAHSHTPARAARVRNELRIIRMMR
jgi:hypothetical protein